MVHFFWLDSRIEDVKWLTRQEKSALTEAIESEGAAAVEKYGEDRASFWSTLHDPRVGLLSSLPWLCAMVAMFALARVGDRTGRHKPILIGQLLAAGAGTLIAALVSPWWALAWLCVAAMGFKSISPVFWPIVQRTVNPMTIGVAIAVLNSIANLGGFVTPFGFGLAKEHTGSTQWALIALGCLSFVAAFA